MHRSSQQLLREGVWLFSPFQQGRRSHLNTENAFSQLEKTATKCFPLIRPQWGPQSLLRKQPGEGLQDSSKAGASSNYSRLASQEAAPGQHARTLPASDSTMKRTNPPLS